MKKVLFVSFVMIFTMMSLVSCDAMKSKIIEQQVAIANAQCPMNAGEGLVMQSVTKEGNYIIYQCDVDEALISIALLNESASTMKEAMKAQLHSEGSDVQKFLKACKDSGIGITYHYVGTISGNVCDIQIESYEL